MFSFVVRYLGFLKSLPLLPHYFDSLLKLGAFFTRPCLLDWIDDIEAAVLQWEGVSAHLHKYGGVQFNHRSREMGHLHGNGLLDVLCGTRLRDQLVEAGRARPHHLFANTGWISFYIRTNDDKEYALYLLGIVHQKLCSDLKNR